MSHKMLRPCIAKVSVLGYFPLILCVYYNYSKYFENKDECKHMITQLYINHT